MDNPETLALGTLNITRRQTKLKKHLWELTQCTIKKKIFDYFSRHMEEQVFQMTFPWLVYFLQQEQFDLPMVQTRYIADLSQGWNMQSTTNQNCDLFLNIFYL